MQQIPGVDSKQQWFSVQNRLPWISTETQDTYILPLPALIRSQIIEQQPLSLVVQEDPPESPSPLIYTTERSLLIPLKVTRVRRRLLNNTTESGSPESEFLSNVYEVKSTDDETRGLLQKLLKSGNVSKTSLSLLYKAPHSGYASDPIDLSKHPIFFFKSNLSTTNEAPEDLLLRNAKIDFTGDSLGPTTGRLDDPKAFLQLLWECSVVHASGFFLSYAQADGQGFDTSLFTEDTADISLIVQTNEGTGALQPYHTSLIVKGTKAKNLFVGLTTTNEKQESIPVLKYHPSYPAGCIGIALDWLLEELLSHPDVNVPFDAVNVAALYHLIQFKVEKTEQRNSEIPSFKRVSMELLSRTDSRYYTFT